MKTPLTPLIGRTPSTDREREVTRAFSGIPCLVFAFALLTTVLPTGLSRLGIDDCFTVCGERYRKPRELVVVTFGVVTDTAASPAEPDGVTAVIVVSDTTLTDVADLPPNVTSVAPATSVPVIVTFV